MIDNVFKYFEEISSIPRGSGNTDAISDYCVGFARKRQLKFRQDKAGNVIIWKPGSVGRENEDAVIIQGHLDMVNEKEPGYSHDFSRDGLELVYDDDMLYAKGTTLGGDDGIAIAYALAVLDDDSISHPPMEVVFTVDEEIGMLGAAVLDMSDLKGKYLLNIDSEEEDTILVSCAGGMTAICDIPMVCDSMHGLSVSVAVMGLKGGHSGTEIDKERGNAVVIMGRVLREISEENRIGIAGVIGGQKDNAIIRECVADLVIDEREINKFEDAIRQIENQLQGEYSVSDSEVFIEITRNDIVERSVLTDDSRDKLIMFLNTIPNGIQNMSMNIDGLVETSLNLGVFGCDVTNLHAGFSIRSSVASRKENIGNKIKYITRFLGGSYRIEGNYPAWEYRQKSELRDKMLNIYEKMFGKRLKVQAIHAGLECGYFINGIPGVDIVSFGPDIFDIHTTEERMSISSVKRIYQYLIEILKEI